MISQEVADKVLERVFAGQSVRTICKGDDKPCVESSFYEFVSRNEEFAKQYARACVVRASIFEGDILDIADGAEETPEALAKARLKIDSRKWLMSKMAPKKYGDKIQTEVSGPDGGAIQISASNLSDDELAVIAAGKQ